MLAAFESHGCRCETRFRFTARVTDQRRRMTVAGEARGQSETSGLARRCRETRPASIDPSMGDRGPIPMMCSETRDCTPTLNEAPRAERCPRGTEPQSHVQSCLGGPEARHADTPGGAVTSESG